MEEISESKELELLLQMGEGTYPSENPPLAQIPISYIEAVLMLEESKKTALNFHIPVLAKMITNLTKAIKEAGTNGAFIKLNIASPKDAWGHKKPPHIFDAESALKLLMSSNRIKEFMINELKVIDSKMTRLTIVVKRYEQYDVDQEIRVFVLEGKVRGIMQYNYYDHIWKTDPKEIISLVEKKKFAFETCAADFLITKEHLKLVEYNPLELSDQFLFDGEDFPDELEFRFIKASNEEELVIGVINAQGNDRKIYQKKSEMIIL